MFEVSYQGTLYKYTDSVLLKSNKDAKSQTTSFLASFVSVLPSRSIYPHFQL